MTDEIHGFDEVSYEEQQYLNKPPMQGLARKQLDDQNRLMTSNMPAPIPESNEKESPRRLIR